MGKTIATWRGKPLEDMSKAELIEALTQMSGFFMQSSQEHIRQLKVLGGDSNG